jgi:cell division protease FtsH
MSEFDKVIGYEAIKFELKRVCDVLKNFEKYEKLGVKQPTGILLHGNAGVGKTLMATVFNKETNWNVFVCRKDKPNGDFVNQIKNTYEQAEKNQPAIVFLDDMDKFANED